MRPLIHALLLALLLSLEIGCAAREDLNLLALLQTQAQTQNQEIPSHLTDLGILKYGEGILAAWGFRSKKTEVWNVSGQVALAALSTGALATAGGGVSPDITRGLIGGGNFILQLVGIMKPAERNDARHEGAAMILDARGAFLEALAAKKIYHVSNRRFTPQGSLYFKQIGAAVKVVDKLTVGLAPRIEDLEQVRRVPPGDQPDPPDEVVREINREIR